MSTVLVEPVKDQVDKIFGASVTDEHHKEQESTETSSSVKAEKPQTKKRGREKISKDEKEEKPPKRARNGLILIYFVWLLCFGLFNIGEIVKGFGNPFLISFASHFQIVKNC